MAQSPSRGCCSHGVQTEMRRVSQEGDAAGEGQGRHVTLGLSLSSAAAALRKSPLPSPNGIADPYTPPPSASRICRAKRTGMGEGHDDGASCVLSTADAAADARSSSSSSAVDPGTDSPPCSGCVQIALRVCICCGETTACGMRISDESGPIKIIAPLSLTRSMHRSRT